MQVVVQNIVPDDEDLDSFNLRQFHEHLKGRRIQGRDVGSNDPILSKKVDKLSGNLLELSSEFSEFKSRIASQVQSLQESFDKAVVDFTAAITDLRNRVGAIGSQEVILFYVLIKQFYMLML